MMLQGFLSVKKACIIYALAFRMGLLLSIRGIHGFGND